METFFRFLVLSLWIHLQFVFSPSHNLWNASRIFCYSCVLLRRDLQPTSYLVFPSFPHLFISNSVQIFIDILYTDAIETKRNKKIHCATVCISFILVNLVSWSVYSSVVLHLRWMGYIPITFWNQLQLLLTPCLHRTWASYLLMEYICLFKVYFYKYNITWLLNAGTL